MRTTLTAAGLLAVLGSAGCYDSFTPDDVTGGAAERRAGGGCTNLVGDLGGMPAEARVETETLWCYDCTDPLQQHTLVAGGVVSQIAAYSFTADLYGGSGYGEMIDYGSGERLRIKIDIAEKGMYLTTNPHEGLYPTTYAFACR